MLPLFRRDAAFWIFVLFGLYALGQQWIGQSREQAAWENYRVANACYQVNTVAWKCSNGKSFLRQS